VGVQVWRNGASLTASLNPIPVTGGAWGTATLKWTAPNVQTIEVRVGSPTGGLLTYGGNKGSVTTGAWVNDGATFYLQDVSGGKPLTADNTLATTVVHLQQK
jgi:hypothetical protein